MTSFYHDDPTGHIPLGISGWRWRGWRATLALGEPTASQSLYVLSRHPGRRTGLAHRPLLSAIFCALPRQAIDNVPIFFETHEK
jgi:hypothetical protein